MCVDLNPIRLVQELLAVKSWEKYTVITFDIEIPKHWFTLEFLAGDYGPLCWLRLDHLNDEGPDSVS